MLPKNILSREVENLEIRSSQIGDPSAPKTDIGKSIELITGCWLQKFDWYSVKKEEKASKPFHILKLM